MTNTEHTIALVTGANRGLGRRLAEALVARGAKVYAAARRPETIDIPGIHVAALHVGYMDTDMVSYIPADQKTDPAVVAELALDGLFTGQPEILADELTRIVKAQLSAAPA
ncbi:SDR family NAD(P)-dependent oxidoreductase [Mycolicibacterium austroafricanum]|uniref:SDR family NAD(P)-dependent oxidoreductase n=1 Tax=Mycolicibacterium austroafricanum TaxID=39687 RepID=UPI001CA352B4|nr:SDR family NAD(P)-dependent oxidoreductase [Mycolicibacterium austroafricanum]QZT63092.1 SDR family NAD(P)-dependent oxidoreductase [Mycolicibacterium austroafricanum]